MTDKQSNGTTAGTATADAPSRPPSPRRLTRRREGKVIGGVAAGLGAYTGIDPVAWRIGFVVLTLVSGVGLLAYLIAWVVIPIGEDGDTTVATDPGRSNRWLGITALVGGAAILAHELWHLRGGLLAGVVLIGVGIALWSWDPSSDESTPDNDGTTDVGDDATPGERSRSIQAPAGPASSPAVQPAPRATAPRERSILGRLVAGTCALVLGGALTLGNLGVIELSVAGVLAALLIVVGAGLLVGSRWGRARWLIAVGILLSLALVAAAVLPVAGGVGDAGFRAMSPSELRPEYRWGVGELSVDLSALERVPEHARVAVELGVGELLVVVPADVPVTVRGRVSAGTMNLLGEVDEGLGLDDRVTFDGDDSLGNLILDAKVGMGEITVRRPSDTDTSPLDRARFPMGTRR